MNNKSRAKEIRNYSFLVVFANDDRIDENELHLIEKLALEDQVVDESEKDQLRALFDRIDHKKVSPEVAQEIDEFRKKYNF